MNLWELLKDRLHRWTHHRGSVMPTKKWYQTEHRMIDLNRYWKIELDTTEEEWTITGLREGETSDWEVIFKGDPEKAKIEWEDMEQILLS